MSNKLAELLGIFEEFAKPIAFFLLISIAVIFRITDKINGAQFVGLAQAVTISFFSVTGIQHFSSMISSTLSSKTGQISDK